MCAKFSVCMHMRTPRDLVLGLPHLQGFFVCFFFLWEGIDQLPKSFQGFFPHMKTLLMMECHSKGLFTSILEGVVTTALFIIVVRQCWHSSSLNTMQSEPSRVVQAHSMEQCYKLASFLSMIACLIMSKLQRVVHTLWVFGTEVY